MRYHIHILTQCSLFGKVFRDVQVQVLQTWLHLEEYEIFGVHNDDVEESEVEDSEERELSQSTQEKMVEKVSVLKMILPHIHHIHAHGVKLDDSKITNTAKELCNYILY